MRLSDELRDIASELRSDADCIHPQSDPLNIAWSIKLRADQLDKVADGLDAPLGYKWGPDEEDNKDGGLDDAIPRRGVAPWNRYSFVPKEAYS